MVIDAGDASRVHAPEKKCISRATATGWWRNQIALFSAETRRTIKVYRVRSEEFFSEFHRGAGTSDNRTVSGGDVEFDGGAWRCREHVHHLTHGWASWRERRVKYEYIRVGATTLQ